MIRFSDPQDLASLGVSVTAFFACHVNLGGYCPPHPAIPPHCIPSLGEFLARLGAPDQRCCLVRAEINPVATPGSKATPIIDVHTHSSRDSPPMSYNSFTRHTAGSKRLYHGRVPVPYSLVINACPTSSDEQIMAGTAASKANRPVDTLHPLLHPKILILIY